LVSDSWKECMHSMSTTLIHGIHIARKVDINRSTLMSSTSEYWNPMYGSPHTKSSHDKTLELTNRGSVPNVMQEVKLTFKMFTKPARSAALNTKTGESFS
jgi:hypothetical protein